MGTCVLHGTATTPTAWGTESQNCLPGRSWGEEGKVEDPFWIASELSQGKPL